MIDRCPATQDLGLALLDAPTEPMIAVVPESRGAPTRPLGIPTCPTMPTLRPYPRVRYPPPVPGRADALTTVLPAMVRA